MKTAPVLLLSLFTLGSLLNAGCGGAGQEDASPAGDSRMASARFSIVWPEASKLIPIASKAVQVDVMQGSTKVASKVAVRGAAGSTTVLDLENLPAGNLTFVASALPNVSTTGTTTASGVPQAVGSAPLKTEAGKTAKIAITMASTIVRLAIFPNPWKLEKLKPSVPARATAYDAQNRVVLTDANRQFTWSSSDTNVLSVSPNSGAVTAREKGVATLTVRDNESGKTATGQVEVVDGLPVDRVVVTPPTANLAPKETLTVIAAALNAEGEDLKYTPDKFAWTSSDPTKATVSATGVVTGVTNGVATIEVKEKVTGKSGTCVVTVEAVGLGDILISGRFNGQEGYARVLSETTVQFYGAYDYRTESHSRIGSRQIYIDQVREGEVYLKHLHVRNRDGSDDHDILKYDSRYYSRALPNADGSKVLVMIAENRTYLPDGRKDLMIVDARTGSVTALPFPPSVTEPYDLEAWSPTGDRYILNNIRRDAQGVGEGDVAVYDRAGVRIRTLPGVDTPMHFSADGNLFVHRKSLAGRPAEIVVNDKDGKQLYNYSVGVSVASVRFHPTRNTLVYVGHDSTTGIERVYECNPDGSNNHVVFSGTNPRQNQINLFWR